MEEKSTKPEAGSVREPVTPLPPPPPPKKKKYHKQIYGGIAALVVLVVLIFYYLRFVAPYVDTDDAFIDGYTTYISPRVSGPVIHLLITDNQEVKAGDELVEIDPSDYETA
ncbi:MAG TPA: biotin/lipoyl-binding protein, partial [Verrucomicrobiae bacterium]